MQLPQPGEDEEKYVIFALIFMLSNRLQTIGDVFFNEISTKQWFVLLVLGIMEGHSPTLNELSDAVGSSHQNVKQLVLKLEKKGYVELNKDEQDTRKLRIKLTQKSLEFNRAYQDKSTLFMNQLFENFKTSDLSITRNVLSLLKENLERIGNDYGRE